MQNHVKTNVPGLYRDMNSGAVLNKDKTALASYKMKKAKDRKIENEVSQLKEDIEDIKAMLLKLLEK